MMATNLNKSEHIALILTDINGVMIMANDYALRLMGYRREEMLGKSSRLIHGSDDAYDAFVLKTRESLESGDLKNFEYPFRHKDGHVVWLSASGRAIDKEGHKLWTAVDISGRKQIEQELFELKERLEYAIEGNQDVVWDWDILNNKLDISERWKDLIGYDRKDIPYEVKVWRKHLHPEDRRTALEKIQTCLDGKNKYLDFTYRLRHKDGHTVWILMRAITLYDDEHKAIRMVGTHRDITHSKELELQLLDQAKTIEHQRDELWYRAHHDVLTELPNRIYFQQLLEETIEKAIRDASQQALLFVDLDHFKVINDTHGHDVGDEVLRYVADLLRRGVRTDDIVGRLGGDEFTLIIQSVPDDEAVRQVVENLIGLFARPFEFEGGSLRLSASIGIAVYPHDGVRAETLLRHADRAMYRVKQSGRGRYLFYGQEAEAVV
jgi:diguanylate cyclase (GGDEF)-like protein/PAS domain S-box-containing protein